MLKGYLEPNIINWAQRANWTGTELRRRLEARGLEPYFGIHGIYELARGLLSKEHAEVAQSNFQILAELDPIFGPTPQILFSKELDLLQTGATVIPVLDDLNRASAKYQVHEMAAGRIEIEGVELIKRRQAAFARDYDHYVTRQLSAIGTAISSGATKPKTFEQVVLLFDSHIPAMIRQLLRRRVTVLEANAIYARLQMFPAIRSTIRSNLYLWAIPWLNGAGASRDKTDDYRHIIEASYSHVFVTGDRKLTRALPHIHPGLEVLMWNAI